MINSEDRLIPEKTLLVIPNRGIANEEVLTLLEPLSGNKKRDWFNPHFYYCLPLTIGNQYGFIVKAQRDFTVYWNGGPNPDDITIHDSGCDRILQLYDGHFGEGVVTVQNFWHYRTAPGVNLMTITPPNFPQHGLMHMTGVIETDNLRRDFTFNFRVTKPHIYIQIKAGDPIGAFIPVPRWYCDQFDVKFADELFTEEEISLEHQAGDDFAKLRTGEDRSKPRAAGRLYFKGVDAYGNEFPDHQKN